MRRPIGASLYSRGFQYDEPTVGQGDGYNTIVSETWQSLSDTIESLDRRSNKRGCRKMCPALDQRCTRRFPRYINDNFPRDLKTHTAVRMNRVRFFSFPHSTKPPTHSGGRRSPRSSPSCTYVGYYRTTNISAAGRLWFLYGTSRVVGFA